jgi:N-acetylglutamate synthase-like GNAT family acetyltransferase
MSSVSLRPARTEDAEGAVAVMRASISELCQADHHDDATTLERWLANKTVETFRRWLANPDSFFVVAELAGEVCGVAAINRGEVTLCYVKPGRERSGLGTALLGMLEERAKSWQLAELRLNSTDRARAFYEHCGYAATGEIALSHGSVRSYGYTKPL